MRGSNHIRYSTAMPDMKYINSQIPILEIARALGIGGARQEGHVPRVQEEATDLQCEIQLLAVLELRSGRQAEDGDRPGDVHSQRRCLQRGRVDQRTVECREPSADGAE